MIVRSGLRRQQVDVARMAEVELDAAAAGQTGAGAGVADHHQDRPAWRLRDVVERVVDRIVAAYPMPGPETQ